MLQTLFAALLLISDLTIQAPSALINVWAVGYMDEFDMLYLGGPPDGNLYYGEFNGTGSVSWTQFDTLQDVCGFGCYQDNVLFAITQMDPFNPGPFYLCTWELDSQGIPQLPAETFQLGTPFIGTFGGCEWDGDFLWILDQNFQADDNATVYMYDVFSYSVLNQWDYGELGGVGLACVWDSSELYIWVSDWYGGFKITEHTMSGTPTGNVLNISNSSTDMAFRYSPDLTGSGFFVGNHSDNTVVFYPYALSSLTRSTWGEIKGTFR